MAALPLAKAAPVASEEPAFLNIECSAGGCRWVDRLGESRLNIATVLSQQHDLPLLLARMLVARGCSSETLEDFLKPTLRNLLPDPSTLQDMDKGAERLAAAIRSGEGVAIFGDYDVDGASSASLMARFLRAHGVDPQVYIPDRITEGYGPNEHAFSQLVTAGASLIITVDCGTMAHEPIEHARSLGADVIVVDHHLTSEELPNANAIINPNRLDDLSGQGDLAAAGVTFLFLVGTARILRQTQWYSSRHPECDLREWLDIVALATVCDVVPLTGLNRAFVRSGLRVLHRRSNAGLRALGDIAGLNVAPTSYHLGFVLGPRINAGGRIGDASLGYRLLATHDDLEAADIAATLDRLNSERKAMEAIFVEDAMAQAEMFLDNDPDLQVLVTQGEEWHKGVVGLVASRLTGRFSRPAIAIAWENERQGSGSARSVAGIDIGTAIQEACAAGHLVKGGGHAMAAGLTVRRDSLSDFKDFLQSRIARAATDTVWTPELQIDGVLTASSGTPAFMDQMDQAGPFGAGNPLPRFVFASHKCTFAKVVGDAHVRCTLSAGNGGRIGAIAFRAANTELGRALLESDGMPLHVAGHLRRDNWGGREKIELVIEDAARVI